MIGQILLIGAGYFISSFFFNTGWDDSHKKYNNKVSTEYSKLFINYIESQQINDGGIKKHYLDYNQNRIAFEYNSKNKVTHQLSYATGLSNLLIENKNVNSYNSVKTKEVKSTHHLLMFDSSYRRFNSLYGIKPVVHFNVGVLHLRKKETFYSADIEDKVTDVSNSTTMAALLDTKLRLLWKGYTLKLLPSSPIMYSEIGVTFKQNDYYICLNFGGSYQLIDQFNIQGQWGLKPLYSKSNTLVGNARIGVEYQF